MLIPPSFGPTGHPCSQETATLYLPCRAARVPFPQERDNRRLSFPRPLVYLSSVIKRRCSIARFVEKSPMEAAPPNSEPNSYPPGSPPGEDGTLGGYLRSHSRPPAFQGPDGYPYTVSVEVEKSPDLATPFLGYLVFPRWAESGAGIIGHLETPIILKGKSPDEVRSALGDLTLSDVRKLLDEALAGQHNES